MRLIPILLSAVGAVYAQSTAYQQCGGIGWTGATICITGWACIYSNPWYSQCLPCTGSCISSSPSSSKTSSVTPSSTKVSSSAPSTSGTTTTHSTSGVLTTLSTSSTKTTTGLASTTVPGGYPGTTLQSGYYWIRAVESPNFHSYLQTTPTAVSGTAILSSYLTAGQFNIISGQLVELTSSGLLYANVQIQPNSTVTKLAVTFETTQNTYGSFAFSGDSVQWSVASISRPNLSAWLVCANQQLFINLGAYDYMTPAGCADETIHYYNGATANN